MIKDFHFTCSIRDVCESWALQNGDLFFRKSVIDDNTKFVLILRALLWLCVFKYDIGISWKRFDYDGLINQLQKSVIVWAPKDIEFIKLPWPEKNVKKLIFPMHSGSPTGSGFFATLVLKRDLSEDFIRDWRRLGHLLYRERLGDCVEYLWLYMVVIMYISYLYKNITYFQSSADHCASCYQIVCCIIMYYHVLSCIIMTNKHFAHIFSCCLFIPQANSNFSLIQSSIIHFYALFHAKINAK